jgi:hypothetical protein
VHGGVPTPCRLGRFPAFAGSGATVIRKASTPDVCATAPDFGASMSQISSARTVFLPPQLGNARLGAAKRVEDLTERSSLLSGRDILHWTLRFVIHKL